MKFVFASDSFKGSLSSSQIIDILEKTAKRCFPDCITKGVPVGDGGEGTAEALLQAMGGEKRTVKVKAPLFNEINADYGILPNHCAIIEMASASGLPLVPENQKNPLKTTTYGTGELISDALSMGCEDIYIAIGGSATNDGGMGVLSALGVRFLDENSNILVGCGENLAKVRKIDTSLMSYKAKNASFHILCDVSNPLLGETGAANVYAKQKGASLEEIAFLENGMRIFADAVKEHTGNDFTGYPGAGAAGGLGFGLMSFLNAKIGSGIEEVLNLIEFDRLIDGADMVITGEGHMDAQSIYGKVPIGVSKRCKRKGIPVVAIVGGVGRDYQAVYQYGISSVFTTVNDIMTLDHAIENARHLYEDASLRLFSFLKAIKR